MTFWLLPLPPARILRGIRLVMGEGRGVSGWLEGGLSDGGKDYLEGRSARMNSCHFLPSITAVCIYVVKKFFLSIHRSMYSKYIS